MSPRATRYAALVCLLPSLALFAYAQSNLGDVTLGSGSSIPEAALTATAVVPGDYDAKGKILVGTGSGTFTALAAGADTQILTADSAEASGVKWAAAAAGGGGKFVARWAIVGSVASVETAIDAAYVVPAAVTVTDVYIMHRHGGDGGSCVVDINEGGTTLYTTQGNRPTLSSSTADLTVVTATDPDDTALAAGAVLTCDIDTVQDGAQQDLIVELVGTYD